MWVLSSRELSLYDGKEGSKGLYLAVLGQVFDVHKGHKHYGRGGAYHFMAGNLCRAHIVLMLHLSVNIKPHRDLSMLIVWTLVKHCMMLINTQNPQQA